MKLKISGGMFRCARCRKAYFNPLGHKCVIKSDFKQRKAEAAKAARKARPPHLYQACADLECRRLPCVAWREGLEEGRRAGREEGFEEGFAAGQAAGSRAS